MKVEQTDRIFTYHAPTGTQPERYRMLRRMGQDLADQIIGSCPYSEERTLALRKLQEVVMWANASIAINENEVK